MGESHSQRLKQRRDLSQRAKQRKLQRGGPQNHHELGDKSAPDLAQRAIHLGKNALYDGNTHPPPHQMTVTVIGSDISV